jgi:hypothetical protein
VRDALLKNIKRRMTPQPLKIRADVELTCFHYDGIEHIKTAMRAAEATSTEDCQVQRGRLARSRVPGPAAWAGRARAAVGAAVLRRALQRSIHRPPPGQAASLSSRRCGCSAAGPLTRPARCPPARLQVKMKLVAPPLYVLTTQTLDKVKGVEVRLRRRGPAAATSPSCSIAPLRH